MPPIHILTRILRLALCLLVLWAILWGLTPVLVAHIPALAKYGDVALEHNIQPGALYYTDVPVSGAAEQNNRDTVRFLPRDRKKP